MTPQLEYCIYSVLHKFLPPLSLSTFCTARIGIHFQFYRLKVQKKILYFDTKVNNNNKKKAELYGLHKYSPPWSILSRKTLGCNRSFKSSGMCLGQLLHLESCVLGQFLLKLLKRYPIFQKSSGLTTDSQSAWGLGQFNFIHIPLSTLNTVTLYFYMNPEIYLEIRPLMKKPKVTVVRKNCHEEET